MAARREVGTRVYALLGHPVHHSLSPQMQSAAFRAAGQDAAYLALDVPPDRLEASLRGLHAAGVAGLNLTAPHKEAAWPYLSGATADAEESRAVNTLRRDEAGWFGHATDGLGFRDWIGALGIPVSGARILLIGAGGAARSIAPILASFGPAAVQVVSRNGAHAREVANALRARALGPTDVEAAALDESRRAESLPNLGLLIRALATESIETAEGEWWDRLDPGAAVLDLNYGPRALTSRARAAAEGRRFEDGLGLLLHQGVHSYEFWTGQPAPLEAMRAALTRNAG